MHRHVDVLVIGGGQAGLATSRCLRDRGIDHVVLERGRIGERWRSERWDSLRLLTPAWQARLPGAPGVPGDPGRFLDMSEVTGLLERYADSFGAPVEEGVEVRSVRGCAGRFGVETSRGTWTADHVVVATGACGTPWRPPVAADLGPGIDQLAPTAYRNPSRLAPGGVLVVGAGASGVQLADEIARSGRRVHLAVGDHSRMPRRYRGRDIQDWLDAIGLWREDTSTSSSMGTTPSLQLVGSDDGRDVDLSTLAELGVGLSGRLVAVSGHTCDFDDSLPSTVAASERRLNRLLDRIDAHIALRRLEAPPPDRPSPLRVQPGCRRLDLAAAGIGTVVWATGFRNRYDWLQVPVLDSRGQIRHRRGVTAVEGIYTVGLPGQTRRNSTFLDGVGADAEEVVRRIEGRIVAGSDHRGPRTRRAHGWTTTSRRSVISSAA